jgi:hypothetical protein
MHCAQCGLPIPQCTSAEISDRRMKSRAAASSSGDTADRSHPRTSPPRARISAARTGASVPFRPVRSVGFMSGAQCRGTPVLPACTLVHSDRCLARAVQCLALTGTCRAPRKRLQGPGRVSVETKSSPRTSLRSPLRDGSDSRVGPVPHSQQRCRREPPQAETRRGFAHESAWSSTSTSRAANLLRSSSTQVIFIETTWQFSFRLQIDDWQLSGPRQGSTRISEVALGEHGLPDNAAHSCSVPFPSGARRQSP